MMYLSSMSKFSMVMSSITLPLNLLSNMLSCTSFSMFVRSLERLETSPFLV